MVAGSQQTAANRSDLLDSRDRLRDVGEPFRTCVAIAGGTSMSATRVAGAVALHEAAFVLRASERDVRNRLRRGELAPRWVGHRRYVDADELARELADDLLAALVLRRLLAGELEAPRAETPNDRAPDLLVSLTELM